MEEASDPVVLNVYELSTTDQQGDGQQQQQQQPSTTSVSSSISSFFQRILPQAGLGAYHTSLDVNGYCYTFGVGGIGKVSIANKHSRNVVPPNATFQQSITLGSCNVMNDYGHSQSQSHSKINEIVNKLRNTSFTTTSYHLLNRNCNHFTETFATALIIADDLVQEKPSAYPLKKYPRWVNRLARSGTNVINHGDVCDVIQEARVAVGVEGKVGWDLNNSHGNGNGNGSASNNIFKGVSARNTRSKKKELTEKQKKALAKLKK